MAPEMADAIIDWFSSPRSGPVADAAHDRLWSIAAKVSCYHPEVVS